MAGSHYGGAQVSQTGSFLTRDAFGCANSRLYVRCTFSDGDSSSAAVPVDQSSMASRARSKKTWARRAQREGQTKSSSNGATRTPFTTKHPAQPSIRQATLVETGKLLEGLSTAEFLGGEWLSDADYSRDSPACSCCDELLSKIQKQLTSLRSTEVRGEESPRNPGTNAVTSPRPIPGSSQQPASPLISSERDVTLAVPSREAEDSPAFARGVNPTQITPHLTVARGPSAASGKKAVLRKTEVLMQKLLESECCSTALPLDTWHDLLEQSIKLRRFRQAVHWAKLGASQGLKLRRKTFERLVAAASRGKNPQPAQVLWDIWILRSCVDQASLPLSRALGCALIRALGRQGEPQLAELIFLELWDGDVWHPQTLPAAADLTSVSDEEQPVSAEKAGRDNPGAGRGARAPSSALPHLADELKGMHDHPAVMAFNSIMEAHSRAGDAQQVQQYFQQMVSCLGIRPNQFSFSALIRAYCATDRISEAETVLESMSSFDVEPDAHIYSILMHWYAKRGRVDKVLKLQGDMQLKGVPADRAVSCCVMQAYAAQGRAVVVKRVFCEVEGSGVGVDGHLLCTVVHSLGQQGRLSEAWNVLLRYKDDSRVATSPVWTAAIGASLRHGDSRGAEAALERLGSLPGQPGIQTFNTLLWGLLRCQGEKAAAAYLQRTAPLWGPGLVPNLSTYSILIHLSASKGDGEGVCLLLDDMREAGLQPDRVFLRSLRQSFAASGLVMPAELATRLLGGLEEEG